MPPGVATSEASSDGSRSASRSIDAAPNRVCTTVARASPGGRPCSTAASAIDAAKWYRNAGPEPATAVIASIPSSPTQEIEPTRENRAPTPARASPSRWMPPTSAVAACPTAAAVLVMARAAGRPGPSASSNRASGTAAASETATAPSERAGAIPAATGTSAEGRTATRATSAPSAAAAPSVPEATP